MTLNKELCFIRANKTKFGGAEVYLSRLSASLEEKGIAHRSIHSNLPKFLPSWLRIILFNLQVCLTKGDKFYFSLDRISCPDVYRAGDGVHKVFLKIEKKSKINPLHPIYLFLERRCFNKAKHIVANSHMIRNEIMDMYNIRPDKISVVYNGIQNKKVERDNSFKKLSQEFPIRESSKILLYVGSGFKRKGVSEFLKIFSMLQTNNTRAFIVGGEKDMATYQELSKELMVDDKVFFTGPREDVDDFYSISHVFILPTHYEPFSNVVLEAMNFKNVVFTTRQNGASEILHDNFIMNDPNDLSIVTKIDSLLQHEDLLQEEAARNRKLSQQFSIQKNLLNTLDVIHKVAT